jgi:hypothetical protein
MIVVVSLAFVVTLADKMVAVVAAQDGRLT